MIVDSQNTFDSEKGHFGGVLGMRLFGALLVTGIIVLLIEITSVTVGLSWDDLLGDQAEVGDLSRQATGIAGVVAPDDDSEEASSKTEKSIRQDENSKQDDVESATQVVHNPARDIDRIKHAAVFVAAAWQHLGQQWTRSRKKYEHQRQLRRDQEEAAAADRRLTAERMKATLEAIERYREKLRAELLTRASNLRSVQMTFGAQVDQDNRDQQTPATRIRGFLLNNPKKYDRKITFTLNDEIHVLSSGKSIHQQNGDFWTIRFHRGGEFGYTEYKLPSGEYSFTADVRGWDLIDHETDDVVHPQADSILSDGSQ